MDSSDQALLTALQGDAAQRRQALATLYDEHAERLRRYFIAQHLTPDEAEDRVQDTFVNVLRHLDSYRGDSRFSAWLWAIARNELLMFFRSAKRRECAAGDDLPEQAERDDASGPGLVAGLQDCVQQALALFEQSYRDYAQVIRLVSFYDWGVADVAAFLGKKPGATREYLSQSRKRLAPFLERCLEFITP